MWFSVSLYIDCLPACLGHGLLLLLLWRFQSKWIGKYLRRQAFNLRRDLKPILTDWVEEKEEWSFFAHCCKLFVLYCPRGGGVELSRVEEWTGKKTTVLARNVVTHWHVASPGTECDSDPDCWYAVYRIRAVCGLHWRQGSCDFIITRVVVVDWGGEFHRELRSVLI